MKKIILVGLVLLAVCSYAVYNIGDTVLPANNLSWTDNIGYSTNIFDEITLNKNVVVIFWGGSG